MASVQTKTQRADRHGPQHRRRRHRVTRPLVIAYNYTCAALTLLTFAFGHGVLLLRYVQHRPAAHLQSRLRRISRSPIMKSCMHPTMGLRIRLQRASQCQCQCQRQCRRRRRRRRIPVASVDSPTCLVRDLTLLINHPDPNPNLNKNLCYSIFRWAQREQ